MISDEILCKLPSSIPVYTVEYDYSKLPTKVNLWEAVVELVDARRKIAKLEQRIRELEEAQRWIPVSERLPEVKIVVDTELYSSDTILVDWHYDNYSDKTALITKEWVETEKAWLIVDGKRKYWMSWGMNEVEVDAPNAPTVWRPLPEPPEEK